MITSRIGFSALAYSGLFTSVVVCYRGVQGVVSIVVTVFKGGAVTSGP